MSKHTDMLEDWRMERAVEIRDAAPDMLALLEFLVGRIEDCDPCGGTGKNQHSRADACRDCGGLGEVLAPSAIEPAIDARAILAHIKGE